MRFLIASGPTREPLDPVRYISNYSTGTMGTYLMVAAKKRGHSVDWVRSPDMAETARDLEKVLKARLSKSQVLIMATAVADVRPRNVSAEKIKKEALRVIRLTKNPDILAGLAKKKKKGQIFIGFALESSDLEKKGRMKLLSKGLDAILVQPVTARKSPFGEGRVKTVFLRKKGVPEHWSALPKAQIAARIIREAEKMASAD